MLSLRQITGRIASGESTAEAELARVADTITAREPEVAAFASRPDTLLAGRGPLAGVAVGVKDIVDTADLPTQMGSAIYEGWRPRADASIVSALKAAGATVAGKTRTTAFAFMDPTTTRNPHHPDATPGGSSSGSAAAVAAGMVPLAVGTQTGGSVIRPAAFCGVAGIKPSFGLLPTVGVKTFSWSLDTLGLFAARADDLGCALAAITGRPALDAPPAVLKGLRVAVTRQDFAAPADPVADEALEAACMALAASGAEVSPVSLAPALGEAFAAHGPLQDFEALQALAWEQRMRGADLPPKLAAYLEAARGVTPRAYDTAREKAGLGRAACADLFAKWDVLVTYAAPGEAPGSRETTGDPRFNRLWTLMGVPCLTIPVLRGPAGLPVGVQLIAGIGKDDRVVAVAKALETALAAGR